MWMFSWVMAKVHWFLLKADYSQHVFSLYVVYFIPIVAIMNVNCNKKNSKMVRWGLEKHIFISIYIKVYFLCSDFTFLFHVPMNSVFCKVRYKQGKSEGFESCDWPIIRKCPIWVKIGDVLSRVTLKFDGWPWKTIGHLSFAVSSYVQHFIAIGEFKLELLSGNAQFGSNSMIFRVVWPWNLTYDLEKQ